MPGILATLSLWSAFPCEGGQELVKHIPLLATVDPHLEERADPKGSHWLTRRLTFGIPGSFADRDLLEDACLLARIRTPSGTLVDYDFRIEDLTDGFPSGRIDVMARGPEFDLLIRDQLRTAAATVSGTPAALLQAYGIALAPSYVDLGTVTPQGEVLVTLGAGDLAWDVAEKIAQAVEQFSRTRYQLSLVRIGTSGYELACTIVGATATVPVVRDRKNLIDVTRRRSHQVRVNRVVITGADGQFTTGDALWLVSSVPSGTTVRIQDLAGGLGPAQEIDQFNGGGYVVVDDAGTEHTITDTAIVDAQTTEFTMASSSGLTAGDLCRIMRTGKVRIAQLDSPARQALHGVRLRKYPAAMLDQATNLVGPNADQHLWASALPDGWTTFGGGTASKDTGFFLTGGASLKLVAGASGPGINAPSLTYYALEAETLMFSIWIACNATNGASVGCNVNGTPAAGSPIAVTWSGANTWKRVDLAVPVTAGANLLRIFAQVTAIGGLTIWVDAGMILNRNEVLPFRLGSQPAKAWQLAHELMATNAERSASYRMRAADLTRVDPARFPFDGYAIGGTVDVRATGTELAVLPRVTRIDWNLRNPADVDFDLTNPLPDLVRLVT